MLATAMTFWAKPGVGAGYLAVWLSVMAIGFSICTLAQTAWAARLSRDYDQRSRIYGWWQGANMIGMLLVLVLPAVIGMRVKDDGAAGVAAMGWAVVLLTPLAIGLAAWRAPEPPPAAEAALGWSRTPALLRRRTVWRLMLADLLLGLAPGVNGALFLFFFRQAKGYEEGPANLLLLAYFAAGLLGAPVWSWLAKRTEKHRALAFAALFAAAAQAGVLMLPPLPLALIAPAIAMVGLPYCAAPILLRSMVADASDELRADTGHEGAGLLYSLFVATSKVGYALAVGMAYQALALVGFQAAEGSVNSDAALRGLTLVYIAGTTGFSLLGAAVIWRYPLGRARHAVILDQLSGTSAA
jgi:Na+/melibiose symporter-like transporter